MGWQWSAGGESTIQRLLIQLKPGWFLGCIILGLDLFFNSEALMLFQKCGSPGWILNRMESVQWKGCGRGSMNVGEEKLWTWEGQWLQAQLSVRSYVTLSKRKGGNTPRHKRSYYASSPVLRTVPPSWNWSAQPWKAGLMVTFVHSLRCEATRPRSPRY